MAFFKRMGLLPFGDAPDVVFLAIATPQLADAQSGIALNRPAGTKSTHAR